jgi:hypothetical protein
MMEVPGEEPRRCKVVGPKMTPVPFIFDWALARRLIELGFSVQDEGMSLHCWTSQQWHLAVLHILSRGCTKSHGVETTPAGNASVRVALYANQRRGYILRPLNFWQGVQP